MKKLLICFPYWDGDLAQVEKVARLAADLLKEKTPRAEIAFIQRFDASAPSTEIQNHVAQKFDRTRVWICDRRGEGFPGGCNELAYGIISWLQITKHTQPKEMEDIEGFVILEGDCVITRENWVDELWDEFGKMQAQGKCVAGALIPENQYCKEHINAVAMYAWNVLTKIPALRGGPYLIGWDGYHGPSIVPNAMKSQLFHLDYKRPTIKPEDLFKKHAGAAPLVYHGVKDGSALEAVRKKFCL
jgi:hypothetical protein